MTRATATLKINVVAPGAYPTWRQALSTWVWAELPNTALSALAPSPVPPGITGPRSKVDAWCGATLKRAGSVYMLGAAGGHGDYAGNEVNAITLNSATPQWTQLRAPTIGSLCYDGVAVYGDNRRAATHTYYCTQFLDSQNRMVIMPAPGMGWPEGLPAAPGGFPYLDPWLGMCAFSLATNDWLAPETLAIWPGTGDFTAALSCRNPATDDLYYARAYDSGRFWKWTAATNTWSQLPDLWHQNYAGSAIDPTRNRMLIVGDYAGTLDPKVIDITTGNAVSVTFGGLGAAALRMNGYPGVVYDEARDEFLVFKNSTNLSGYRVSAATWAVSAMSMSNAPAQRNNGVLNAIQYVPELRGVVYVNDYYGNVKFMATSA